MHGVSYVDERLLMVNVDEYSITEGVYEDRPYYYVIDRMYNVRAIVDRAGALIERYAYDPYGRPLIRESVGRGDMNNDTDMDTSDADKVDAANTLSGNSLWDPRADMDDDGDVDDADQTIYNAKDDNWPPTAAKGPTVDQAFSDVGNPHMFQGRPHFAIDTAAAATEAVLMLNVSVH